MSLTKHRIHFSASMWVLKTICQIAGTKQIHWLNDTNEEHLSNKIINYLCKKKNINNYVSIHKKSSQMWWHPIIPAVRELRELDENWGSSRLYWGSTLQKQNKQTCKRIYFILENGNYYFNKRTFPLLVFTFFQRIKERAKKRGGREEKQNMEALQWTLTNMCFKEINTI